MIDPPHAMVLAVSHHGRSLTRHFYGLPIARRYLKAARVPLNEYDFPTSKMANVQSQLEKLVSKNYYLHQSAKDAYR